MQEIYRQQYPDMVGAANTTPTTLELSIGRHTEATETDPIVESTETTVLETTPIPVVIESTTSETTIIETTEQVNTPDEFIELDPIHFQTQYPLQTITHEQRDMMLDVLKQYVMDYGTNNPSIKVSFSYINLKYGETMGINDLEPIVPSGSWALPMAILYDEACARGTGSFQRVLTYNGSASEGMSSYIANTYTAGKQFSMRSILNLAVAQNDSIALQYLISALGGGESTWNRISAISSYINFNQDVIYTDYTGTQQRGNYRTSTYDMANYLQYLYYGYLNSPDVYQTLINDLYYSQMPSPYTTTFADASVFHICGRNEITHSYVDAAIIDGDEPFIIVISVEASSYDQAQIAIADLSTYLERYISSCHEPQ